MSQQIKDGKGNIFAINKTKDTINLTQLGSGVTLAVSKTQLASPTLLTDPELKATIKKCEEAAKQIDKKVKEVSWTCCGGIPIERDKNCPVCGDSYDD